MNRRSGTRTRSPRPRAKRFMTSERINRIARFICSSSFSKMFMHTAPAACERMERDFATLAGPVQHHRKASAGGRVVGHHPNVLEEVFEGEDASRAGGAPVTSQVESPDRRRKVSPEVLGEIVVGLAVAGRAMHQDQRVLGAGMLV